MELFWYKTEFGYSEKEIAEKQNAHLFLLKLLSAKDTTKDLQF